MHIIKKYIVKVTYFLYRTSMKRLQSPTAIHIFISQHTQHAS